MRISILIQNAYGVGGTIRTTFNLAGALAERHEVEIVSVFRHREEPTFTLDPRVGLRHLVDLRPDSDTCDLKDPLYRTPSSVFPKGENRYEQYSVLSDRRIEAHLTSLDADVVIGTRPGLNVHIALQAPRHMVRIAQEHLTLETHSVQLLLTLRRLYPRLDAVTTTTEADAAAYRRRLRLPGVRVVTLPNSVPDPGVAPSTLDAKYVVAAGRLAPVKRYGDLIKAFVKVAAERPDWGLRLYGSGAQQEKLERLIARLDIGDRVTMMGTASPIEPEMAKGSMLAVSSSMESFGMTIVEAMRVGLPVVSTDCPLGPGEIISDGVDGLLVPPRDVDALAAAMLRLINDDELRHRMGEAALEKGAQYDPTKIADACEALLEELIARRAGATGRLRAAGRHVGGLGVGAAYAGKDIARAAKRRARRLRKKLRNKVRARLRGGGGKAGSPARGQKAG
ncbi:glycosyltransferase family 4 protein [Actinacidiphila glaucinigra]|uniref:glycosyltransferase family 4 protein n=1 Tax=Actinacidiphila glaucinigra TaxID=235986 RepID=UPI003D8B40B5